MKQPTFRNTCRAALAAAFTMTAAAAPLKVGDPAPAFKVGEWIQGEPVGELAAGTVYVVEFWATWCGPCVASIPHLDELHEKLKDKGVVFIGQNCREKDAEGVRKFVKKMGEKMSYRVAMDDTTADKNGHMTVKWLNAAEQPGIPSAFVVGKDGRIAWIGHPETLKAEMLEQVVAGTFDAAAATASQAREMADAMAAIEILPRLQAAMQAQEWDKALASVDELEKRLPQMADEMTVARLEIGIVKNDAALIADSARGFMKSRFAEDSDVLRKVAWGITTRVKDPGKEALAAAEQAAARAMELTKSGNASVLETMARVLFLQNRRDEAVSMQEKALAAAGESEKEGILKGLECYRNGGLPAVAEGEGN